MMGPPVFRRYTLEDCHQAQGMVVVIDVLRAFSTAAYAFGLGARRIILVGDPEQAFAFRLAMPGCLLMGEVRGFPIPGFDLGNSPAQLQSVDLTGKTLIQRTSAGTQGVIRCTTADPIFAASFCCAQATSWAIRRLSPSQVSFVITGTRPGGFGDEDEACADYLECLIRGDNPDPRPYLERVSRSKDALQMLEPGQTKYPPADLDLCLAADRFPFAMQARPLGEAYELVKVLVV